MIANRFQDQAILKIVYNFLWLFLEKGAQLFFLFFTTVWLARYLGPSDFGVYNYAISFVMLFLPLGQMGLNGVVIHRLVSRAALIRKTLGTAIILQFIGGMIAFLTVLIMLNVLRPDYDRHFFWTLIAASILFAKPFDVLDSFFQSRTESKYVVFAKLISLAAFVTCTIYGIWAGLPGDYFVSLKASSFFIIAVALIYFYHRSAGDSILACRFSSHHASYLLKKSWPLLLSGATAAVYMKLDQIMIGEMADDFSVGIYAAAAQISELWYFLPWLIISSAFPYLIKSKNDQAGYDKKLQILYNFMALCGFLIAVITSVCSNIIINLLYGKEFVEASFILAVHVWAGVFIFMRTVLSRWLIIENLTIYSIITHGAGAMVNVALNFVLIPEYGGLGAAYATVFSYALASYFSLFLIPKGRQPRIMMTNALLNILKVWRWRKTILFKF
ncbi:flippase [Emcibacter sp.]|uniref:flippase n=1 Tax=Emcibacter sp. TaxID=1979954 RepID=UPI002AA828F6|nr:flippase [Emcibacter sp.]